MLLLAEPSAVAGIDETGQGNLRSSEGVVHVFEYYPSTTATADTGGGARGWLKEQWLYRGEAGGQRAKEASFLYRIRDNTLVYLDQQTVYANANGTGALTTTWDYGDWKELFARSVTTRLPAVSAEQNGPGAETFTVQYFDDVGYPSQFIDASDRSVSTHYDPVTGGLLWSTLGGQTTTYVVDEIGRASCRERV